MMNVLAIVVVLVAIYAVKAVVMLRSHDDAIGKSATFSWMTPEEGTVPAWELEGAAKAEAPASLPLLRRVQKARAF